MPGRSKRQESAERDSATTLGGASALLAAGLGRRGVIRASPIGGIARSIASRGTPRAAAGRTLVGRASSRLVLRALGTGAPHRTVTRGTAARRTLLWRTLLCRASLGSRRTRA